jgi:hypothetical protein
MKTKLIFLVMLIVCISCRTNNKPLSDAHKYKIKGELKEVVKTTYKGFEEVNFDTAVAYFHDSPDFVFLTNGSTYSFKEVMAMRPNYNEYLNQKCTMMNDEKYTVLDNSTVLYTAKSKWVANYKDGHSSLADPDALLFIFKKIDSKWKVIYYVDSYINKNVPTESSKGLNQAELLRKFVGNWETPAGKDTTEFIVIKSLQGGNGLSIYAKWVTKGKMLFEGTGFWGYDAAINKIDISIMLSTGDVVHDQGSFTSPAMLEFVNINNAKAYKGISKSMLEFNSPDEIKRTDIIDTKAVTETWERVK